MKNKLKAHVGNVDIQDGNIVGEITFSGEHAEEVIEAINEGELVMEIGYEIVDSEIDDNGIRTINKANLIEVSIIEDKENQNGKTNSRTSAIRK